MTIIAVGDDRYIVHATAKNEEHGRNLLSILGGSLVRDHKTGKLHLCKKIEDIEYEKV